MVVLLIFVYLLTFSEGVSGIFAGENADIIDFPYMVGIAWKSRFFCGGSIINENTILTSAGCTYNNVYLLEVRYGSSNVTHANSTRVQKIIQHENFTGEGPWENYICLLKVDPPIVFSENVQPIKLPVPNAATPELKPGIITGWGQTTFQPFSQWLQKLNVIISTDSYCEVSWKNTDAPVDREYKICATSDMSDRISRGPCERDDGDPLVQYGILYGIFSYNYYCQNKNYPPVYTKISKYVDWINNNL